MTSWPARECLLCGRLIEPRPSRWDRVADRLALLPVHDPTSPDCGTRYPERDAWWQRWVREHQLTS